MKFKIDENLPAELSVEIRALGYDADTVHDEGIAGSPDDQIMLHVQSEKRVLLTLDKGIADVRRYPPDQFFGIVLFRPPSSGRRESLTFVRLHLAHVLTLSLKGRSLVVTQNGIRIR